MPSRLLALVVAVLALATSCAGGVGGGGVAFRVDGHEFSNDDLYDELRALDRNELFRSALQVAELAEPRGDAPESYTHAFVRYVIELRVFFVLVEDEFERRGLNLTDKAIDDALAAFEYRTFENGAEVVKQGDDVLAAFPPDYRLQWQSDQARLDLLQASFTTVEEFGSFVTEAATTADVWISSRYGSWDPESLTISPPAGPLTTSTTAALGF